MITGFRSQLPMGTAVPYLLIPTMISNTAPAGWEAFASSELSVPTYAAFRSFDGINNMWYSQNTGFPQHVGLNAPARFRVVGYAITSGNAANPAPRSFELQGSNGGSSWHTLDARSGVAWSGTYQRQQWSVAWPRAFSSYRLLVTGVAGGSGTRLSELELLQEDDL